MNGWIVAIIIVLALGAFIFWRLRENIDPFWHKTALDRALLLIKEVAIVTAFGAKMFYEKDAGRVSHEAIDRGLTRVFERLYCRYPADRSLHDIKFVVLIGEIAPESRIPCFRVPITSFSPYYNGEWDMMRGSNRKVHYILAAGQLIAWGTPYGDVIIIPSSTDATFIENIADHEFEHVALGYYDPVEYERTKYHAPGTGHPIIPPCPGTEALRTESPYTAVDWPIAQSVGLVGQPRYSCLLLTK
jgi:hypothetical protein